MRETPINSGKKKWWPRVLPLEVCERGRAKLEAEYPGVDTNREEHVHAAFRLAGHFGLTDHEGELVTGIAGNSYRPSRRNLERRGIVVRRGDKRTLPTKRDAVVFVHRDFAPADRGGGDA